MSADEKGFLARWSERKREAAKDEAVKGDATRAESETKQAPADTQARAAGMTAGEPAKEQFDLASLPKLEELTADTDMTVFFKKGVPESIRNAALRKSWALDPAIRNYVNPALDYAYDWNTPGGVPGAGELAPGTDVVRMVAQVMGWLEPQQSSEAQTGAADEPSAPVAQGEGQADVLPQPVRRSEPRSPGQRAADLPAAASEVSDETQQVSRDVASQQAPRRHGSARPE
jgi:hypothetical protein